MQVNIQTHNYVRSLPRTPSCPSRGIVQGQQMVKREIILSVLEFPLAMASRMLSASKKVDQSTSLGTQLTQTHRASPYKRTQHNTSVYLYVYHTQ